MKRPTLRVRSRAARSAFAERGLSLVELLVAMTIGLFLIGAVAALYVATANGSRASTLESQMNEDASLALDILQQQLRLAGYSAMGADGTRHFDGVGVRGCDGGFADKSPDGSFDAVACAAGGKGSDAIAIRYEATLLNTQPVADNSGAVRPSNCGFNGITAWDIGTGVNTTLADNRFYIAPDSNNNNVPTLYCKGKDGSSSSSGFANAEALIPNIEDMQITYAVTSAPEKDKPLPHQITGYLNAGDAELGPSFDAAHWSRVAGVRICILARTSRPLPTTGGERATLGSYVDCEGNRQDGNDDGFLRRTYQTTVQLRNARPAVPAPYPKLGANVRDPWAHLVEGQ
ncbi:PilW family protein [Hydrogenophaga sp. BPS33]|uniref:PilW family protein n=1 Tax=Hydrogenophaga sp. BPS33 TaxID=2651974 RepID=UPI003FA59C08